ncbi:MAG TPA: Crp/Fnr family transcriptional regulator, partial [Bacteroidia bacterium]|nr:Crp/Fnr family transcriptional regulator [Bacteroidia bacterium]
FQVNRDGREQIVYIYSRGDIMGYRPLICGEPNPVSAMSLDETSYYFIPKEDFLRILFSSPEFTRALLISLSYEFSVWANNITVFARQPVKSRVALGLLILEKKFRREGAGEINLSREDFASYVGTVKETLVRVLQEFKKKKIIVSSGRRIKVLKPAALEEIADFF